MAKTPPAMMLYFEDYISLRASLNGEDTLAVIDAMVWYSKEGRLPDESTLSPAARICWNFVRPRIDRDTKAYRKKSESRRAAANKRWNAEGSENANDANDTNGCKCIEKMHMHQNHANNATAKFYANSTQPNSTQLNEVVVNTTEPLPPPPADDGRVYGFDGMDLTADMENCDRAEALIRQYRLPDSDTTLEAVLEDANKCGWERLEAALKEAALKNARERISVVFYRAILYGAPRKEAVNADPYADFERF